MKTTPHILVTGGTGYIGSHTVVELLIENYEVTIVDNLSRSNANVLDSITAITGKTPNFVQLDLCNADAVTTFFNAYSTPFDAIIHFAAYKAVGESVQEPLLYYHNNVVSMINLLQAANTNGCNKIVFSSSCTVYGQSASLPVTELTPRLTAESPYGNTKQICEDILRDTVNATNIQCISLRYFNPIGAHSSALMGELPLGVPNNLVPFITQTAIGKRASLSIFGNDYNTIDGTCVRDYIHVMDLAQAHIKAVEVLLATNQAHHYDIINIGTGVGSSVLQAVNAFEKAANLKLNYSYSPRRSGDVEAMYANVDKAKAVLNFSSQYSLEDALLHQWQWEQALQRNG
ncbi:MAG: UDP-glucose 4-epimerase GalE [Bacteroidia bacterium]|nr:UDP-glucose 4-epimerase GalE [Bacteroidia bacterium]